MAVKEIMPTKRVIGKSPRRIKVLALVCTACTCGFQSQFHFIVNLFAFSLQSGLSPRAFLALFNALKSAKSMHFAYSANALWLNFERQIPLFAWFSFARLMRFAFFCLLFSCYIFAFLTTFSLVSSHSAFLHPSKDIAFFVHSHAI